MNRLTCHLESADSVRTNPTSPGFEIHSSRFFAEAFTRLLFGEQIRSGQIPLFDSHGAVSFYSQLIESLNDQTIQGASILNKPLVLTHYPGLSSNHKWDVDSTDDWKRIYLETLAARMEPNEKSFILSAMPEINEEVELRKELAQLLWQAADTGFSDEVKKQLDSFQLEMGTSQLMQGIMVLDGYFRNNRTANEAIANINRFELKDTYRAAMSEEVLPKDSRLQNVVAAVKQMAVSDEISNRSKAYIEIEKIDSEGDRLLAKELTDSFYMWEQARLAGVGTEITSSAIESEDQELVKLGEVVSDWADKTKPLLTKSQTGAILMRPVLQKGDYKGENSLASITYRKRLTDGLAKFLLRPELMDSRLPIARRNASMAEVYDYWNATVDTINSFEPLKGLVKVNANVDFEKNGVLVCEFCNNHQIGSIATGFATMPEATEVIRDNMDRQDLDAFRDGNEVGLKST